MKRIQGERSVLGAFGATVVVVLLVAWWARELTVGWLAAGLVVHASVLAVTAYRRANRLPRGLVVSQGLLVVALGSGVLFSWQYELLDTDWPRILEQRERDLGLELGARMADVVTRGQRAAQEAAALAGRVVTPTRTDAQLDALFGELEAVRSAMRVDAVAVYADAGDLIAWAGQHRGQLPDSVRMWEARAYFEERPLYSYLYFPMAVPGRSEHGIAAVLVETGVIGEEGEAGFSGVAARTTTRATFRSGGGREAVWSLVAGPDTVAHARLDPLTQREWRERLDRQVRSIVLVLMLLCITSLTSAWLRWTGPGRPVWATWLPLLLLLPLCAVAPWNSVLGGSRLFSPGLYVLTFPFDLSLSLGRVLAILAPGALLLAGVRWRPHARRTLLLWTAAGALFVAIAYPILLRFLLGGASRTLLQGTAAYWIAFQLVTVLLLTIITAPLFPRVDGDAPDDGRTRPRVLLTVALVISVLLAWMVSLRIHSAEHTHELLASLWAIPFAIGALALGGVGGRTGSLARWLAAGTLAATVTLPHLWIAHVEAKLIAAEEELRTLGTRADPFLDFLLVLFGQEAMQRFDAGESGIQLLYRTWVVSGLAQQPYPARIVLWSPNNAPVVQLGSAPMPQIVADTTFGSRLDEMRSDLTPAIIPFTNQPDLSRLLTVPLPDGSVITVMVPPRRTLDRVSAIAPFLGVIEPSTQLALVEPSGVRAVPTDTVAWEFDGRGWRSEAVVEYPDGLYHAHLTVPVPGLHVQLARGALLLTLALALLTLMWVLGVVARGGTAVPRGDWVGWLGGFRARVTLALFAFFLIPTAVFGWVAYSALAGEVVRAAETIARHAATQAVVQFGEGATDLSLLADHVGTDVLRYHSGELFDVSASEGRDLGVYDAWMPPHIHRALVTGEEQEAVQTHTLGAASYVIAYRALPPSGTLGVPMSLSIGDAAVRQREFAHLVLFATVLGGVLSLVLSLMVGRALAGPIRLLQRASAAVGSGRLGVRLPDAGGEFGQLFASFNTMTRRLRRARAREVRSARVLAWGEMARQVAHEIKNPLTPIKLSVQHLRRAYADRHPQFGDILESNVSQVMGEIDRLSEIARAFSRYGAPSLSMGPLTSVDVGTVVRETIMLYRAGDHSIDYVEEVTPGLPRVCARTNELKEVLINLVENSRAAVDGGGRIVIRAHVIEDRVEVEVADNGPGIPPDLLPRIFDPHFSTRSSGTGLGLAIVRRLVESWGGSVTAESVPGEGTTVRVKLATDVPGDVVSPPGN